jgi:flagellar hook-associated protein 2
MSSISSLLPASTNSTGVADAKSLREAAGRALVSSLGVGQFDVASISKALAEADVASKRQYLTDKQTAAQGKMAGFDLLSNALNTIKSNLDSFRSTSTFNALTASSSDSSALGVSLSGKATAGSYEVVVSQRAQAQTLATLGVSSKYAALGEGTLSLTVGGSTKSITVDSSNNTLEGLKGAINAAGLPVNASIVNDGSGYRLVLASQQTGAANSISISTLDSDGNDTDASGLSQFAFGGGTNNMVQTIAAQDAVFSVNGLSLTSATNNVSGVIDGVSLNLNKAQPGVPVSVTIKADTASVVDKVQGFVDDMNAMREVIKYLGSFSKDLEDPTKGSLRGEQGLRSLENNLRSFMQFRSSDGGAVQTMADIGIKSNLDGTYSLDSTKLTAALSSNPNAVGNLFSANMVTSDNQVTYKGSSDKTVAGTYALTVNQIAKQALYLGDTAAGLATDTITINAGDNSFTLAVGGTETNTLTLAAGTYSRDELSRLLQTAINNDANLKAKGESVQVSFDATNNRFQLATDKFGSASTINFTSVSAGLSTNLGLASGSGATGSYAGQDVVGALEKDGNFYSFIGAGQDVKINSFLPGAPKDLEFSIAGTATGSRGDITFQRGFAAQLTKSITDMMNKDNGAIGASISQLAKRDADYTEKLKEVDARYERALARYTQQFSLVNSTISGLNSLRDSLSSSLATKSE